MMQSPERARGIPEEAMLNAEIVITSYFDIDGKLKYATAVGGDPNLAQAIGLCEMAKITIHQTYMTDEPFPPDE
jgi:hypothetical protein